MLGLWDYLSDSCYFDAYIYVSENIGKAAERQYCLWLSFIIFRVICILEWGLATNSHKIVIAFFLWRIENYFEDFFEITLICIGTLVRRNGVSTDIILGKFARGWPVGLILYSSLFFWFVEKSEKDIGNSIMFFFLGNSLVCLYSCISYIQRREH